jgi:3-oxoadipate enol-lactonase
MSACELHHDLSGPRGAPPIVFGGSLGTTLAMWDPQLPALAEDWRVVRYDHRGHGGSPVPSGPYSVAALGGDVVALLDRLELSRVSYCGLSLGGMVGMWLAINAPKRIDRLVLICTSAHLPPAAGWRERAATVRSAASAEAVADAVLGRWFTEPYARDHPDVVARHRQMVAATAPEGYASCCEAIADMDLRPGLAGITAPTLVIAGEQDPATPPSHLSAIAEAIPGAQLAILDPAAHLTSVERAPAVNARIVDHLTTETPKESA